MTIQVLNGEDYSVQHDPATHTILFVGSIRLQSMEDYQPIQELLQAATVATEPGVIVSLDFRHLRFLNSSGINTVSRFVIEERKKARNTLKVLGSQDIYWQQKSLTNLQRLWPKILIEIQ
jgi:hypothetical protein